MPALVPARIRRAAPGWLGWPAWLLGGLAVAVVSGALTLAGSGTPSAAERGTAPIVSSTTPAQRLAWAAIPATKARAASVVVAGGGMSGVAAALAAARRGVSVIVVEPTHLLGGQAGSAGVSAMDVTHFYARMLTDYGLWGEFTRRADYLYRVAYERPTNTCHYSDRSFCLNPSAVDRVLSHMLAAERVPVMRNTAITGVSRSGTRAAGLMTTAGPVRSRVLIDATEDGALARLAGIVYRISDGTSAHPGDSASQCIQSVTSAAMIRLYPEGVPEILRVTSPPPGFDGYAHHFRLLYPPAGVLDPVWGQPGPTGFAGFRAASDFASTAWHTGADWAFTTRTSLNHGNNHQMYRYDLESATETRLAQGRAALRTIGLIYHLQQELGLDWSVATDEGFGARPGWTLNPAIPADFADVARHLPTLPYLRESRRIVGLHTMTGETIRRPTNRGEARWRTDAVAVGTYPPDLHGCRDADDFEERLGETLADKPVIWMEGPFPIPMGVLVPRDLDGYLAAEKNVSQSRLANGATRVHPTVTAIGEAAGALAAVAVRNHVEPRAVPVAAVQMSMAAKRALVSQYRVGGVTRTAPDFRHVTVAAARRRVDYRIARPRGAEPYLVLDRAEAARQGRLIEAGVRRWLD